MAQLTLWQRWWVNAWPHRWYVRRHVPRFLKASPDPFRGEVLEVGVGQGWTSRQILETFPQVELTATDIDRAAIGAFESLRKQYGRRLKIREENVLKLSFDRESFDIVLAINVFAHLSSFGIQKALRELIRVTRPGGLIGISSHELFSLSSAFAREAIFAVLASEAVAVLHDRANGGYDIWVRKAYPIEKNER